MNLLSFDRSAERIATFSQKIPGGVNSHFRAGMAPGPLVFERGEGAHLIDVDGNQLIDYYGGMGAMVLGHNPVGVREAVKKQVDGGILFAGQSQLEYDAANLLCERIPCAERVRFGTSGSEVVQAALRLARAATGRTMVIKFEGHYHGWFDNILWSAAPQADHPENQPMSGSRGQLPVAEGTLEVMGWNNLEAIRQRLARNDVAAVIMEPAMCNQGAITPASGYLAGVREACSQAGTVLIFDEVITGFRLSAGGGQKRFGVAPDLAVFAKAIANGFPLAALVGRAELMDEFANGVLHGGTFNAQPVSLAAMLATQRELTPNHFDTVATNGIRLQDGIRKVLRDANIPGQVTGFGTMFHVGLGLESPARNYRDIARSDKEAYRRLALALLRRGVRALERGAWFISSAHTPDIIGETLEAVDAAVADLANS